LTKLASELFGPASILSWCGGISKRFRAFAICAADTQAGPLARLSRRERFHWLVAPRSTIIQVSPVHSGITEAPQAALDELFRRLVLMEGP